MANFSFNKVIIGGRLTADPELKQTQTGASVATFSVAVNRKYSTGAAKQESNFFHITAWGQTAEHVSRYFHKGSSICIVGSLQNSTWTNQKGEKQYRTDIVADEVMFVDSKGDSEPARPSFKPQIVPKFEEISTDADLPF